MKMKNRDYGFIVSLILIIAIAIFLVINKFQKNQIESYFAILGQKFIELVPEGQNRALLARRFDEFMGLVKSEAVAPDDLEKVAVEILNLASQDSTLNEEEALALLDLSKIYPEEFPSPVAFPENADTKTDQPPTILHRSSGRSKRSLQNYKDVGERLNRVIALEKQIRKLKVPEKEKRDFRIKYDGRIKVELNPKIISEFQNEEAERVLNEIRIMHDDQLLILKSGVQDQVLKSLREVQKSLQGFDSLSLKLEFIDSLSTQ